MVTIITIIIVNMLLLVLLPTLLDYRLPQGSWPFHAACRNPRRENTAGANMVGVNNVAHDAICEWLGGTMLEPCFYSNHVFTWPAQGSRS